jgi:hypothetical protein
MERCLVNNPELSEVHNREIHKPVKAAYVTKVTAHEEGNALRESWYLPHHVIQQHGEKYRFVFNCSFQADGQSLNDCLLPRPTLGPSLLCVLLQFRQHSTAISGDIKAIFHQICLLPSYTTLLRFIWQDMERDAEPTIYEWQVLPYGTTCSPCCAIYALQRHAREHPDSDPEVWDSVENAFYVDNCLQSIPSTAEAKAPKWQIYPLLACASLNHPSGQQE